MWTYYKYCERCKKFMKVDHECIKKEKHEKI